MKRFKNRSLWNNLESLNLSSHYLEIISVLLWSFVCLGLNKYFDTSSQLLGLSKVEFLLSSNFLMLSHISNILYRRIYDSVPFY